MNELRSWLLVGGRVLRYELYRLGLAECPSLMDIYDELMVVIGRCLKWHKRLRIIGTEHCPKGGPAIFVANHIGKADPFNMFRAVFLASGSHIYPRIMMRDDFFEGSPLKSRLLDLDEITRLLGAIQISRDRVRLAQLKPFVNLLEQGECYIMYPGRSRTRTGVFIEYRDGIREPGGVSFFMAQAQRRDPGVRVPVVPMAQTFNPVTKMYSIAFGPPLVLPANAARRQQRELDCALVLAMSDLVEVNVVQMLGAILYLHCLHASPATIERARLVDEVREVVDALHDRHVDPVVHTDLEREVARTLAFFRRIGMVEMRGAYVVMNAEKILTVPPADKTYRRINPVKYHVNQILHLADVVAAVEQAVRTGGAS